MTERLHFHFSLSCIGEEMATHCSILAWRIPRMGEPGVLPSMGSHRVGHDWSDLAVVKILGVKSYVWILTVPITPHCSRVNCSKKKKILSMKNVQITNRKPKWENGNKVAATKHQTTIKVADLNHNIPTNIINISTLNIQIKRHILVDYIYIKT